MVFLQPVKSVSVCRYRCSAVVGINSWIVAVLNSRLLLLWLLEVNFFRILGKSDFSVTVWKLKALLHSGQDTPGIVKLPEAF